jgi:hypothetical protein
VDTLDINLSSNSKVIMVKMIRKEINTLTLEKKMKVVLIVDEASLMLLEVFAELHTICQFEKDSKPMAVYHPGRTKQPHRQTDLSIFATFSQRGHVRGDKSAFDPY